MYILYLCIYRIYNQYLSPLKKDCKLSTFMSNMDKKKGFIIQTNINTASFSPPLHYTWGYNSFQDPTCFQPTVVSFRKKHSLMWIIGPEQNIINRTDRRSSPSTYSEYKYIQVMGWGKKKKRQPDSIAPLCAKRSQPRNGLTQMWYPTSRAKAHTSAALSVRKCTI